MKGINVKHGKGRQRNKIVNGKTRKGNVCMWVNYGSKREKGNGWSGQDAIARRLDRVLVSEVFLSVAGNYRSWVESLFVSDHAPICFQMEQLPVYKCFPFKFNVDWLNQKEFVDIIHKNWKDPMFLHEENKQMRLLWKL